MKFGYARSLDKMILDSQTDLLRKFGCDKIFTDQISGSILNRPGIEEMYKRLNSGDTIIVYKLSIFTNRFFLLNKFLEDLKKKNVEVISLSEVFYINILEDHFIYNSLEK